MNAVLDEGLALAQELSGQKHHRGGAVSNLSRAIRVQGLGLRVKGLQFRAQGLGFRVRGSRFCG
jgi:hypothetical protein